MTRKPSGRKTIDIDTVKNMVNDMLKNSVDDVSEGRIALAVLLENVLITTGNYHGFRYLPGIVDFTQEPPEITGDETRRFYY